MSRIGTKWVLKGAMHWFGDAASFESSMLQEDPREVGLHAPAREDDAARDQRDPQQGVGQDSKLEASYFYLIQKMQSSPTSRRGGARTRRRCTRTA
jgi:hypothetical protein